jgi:predicted nucleic acid-binding protein
MPKKWVVNASPLIVLAKINHLFLLQQLAEDLIVPAGVAKDDLREELKEQILSGTIYL